MGYESSDAVGPFAGWVSATYCSARIGRRAVSGSITAQGKGAGAVSFDGPFGDAGPSSLRTVYVHPTSETGLGRIDPASCSTYDVRYWLDGDKHLHVVVRLECTFNGTRIHGAMESDDCYIERP
jgi:hypothetical protein